MTTATPGSTKVGSAHVVSPGVPSAAVLAAGAGALAVLTAVLSATLSDADMSSRVWGALIGAAMVLAFFGFGALIVDMAAAVMPAASLLIALLTYTLQVLMLGVVFLALSRSGATDSALDATWIGVTVIAATLAWTTGQVVGEVRSRQPIYGSPA